VNGKVVNYARGASEYRARRGNQQIDIRPREARRRMSWFAKCAVVESADMELLKNARSTVDERTKLFNKAQDRTRKLGNHERRLAITCEAT
jgi:hypothetical protein